MPRPPNTRKRRSEIVGGLAHVMADRGYARATIKAIAAAAGLTAGLVHYHFRSKQEILLALVEWLAQRVRERLDPQAAGGRERIFAAIDALVGTRDGVDAEAVACWVVVGAEAVRQPEVRALYETLMGDALAALTQAFRDALREAGRAETTAPAAALSVVAAVEGFFRLAAGAPELVPAGSAASSIHRIAQGFLDAAEPAPPEPAD